MLLAAKADANDSTSDSAQTPLQVLAVSVCDAIDRQDNVEENDAQVNYAVVVRKLQLLVSQGGRITGNADRSALERLTSVLAAVNDTENSSVSELCSALAALLR